MMDAQYYRGIVATRLQLLCCYVNKIAWFDSQAYNEEEWFIKVSRVYLNLKQQLQIHRDSPIGG